MGVPDDIAKQVMKVRDDIANGVFKPSYITQATSQESKPVRVAMALPGPISDRGYNERAYEGL